MQLFRERFVGSAALQEDQHARSDNVFREPCGTAYFWTVQEEKPADDKKTLQGELQVRSGLHPSFMFPTFSLKVRLIVLDNTRSIIEASVSIRSPCCDLMHLVL